jgi:hypothetical protein
MNFRRGRVLNLLCLLAAGSGCHHVSPTNLDLDLEQAVSPPAAETNFRPLFNGRDLSGFYTWLVDTAYEDPRRVFTVTNGWLRLSGDGLGYLATREVFRDYELTVEFKWGGTNTRWGDRPGKARDSGIFLHATGPDGNSHDGDGAFMAAIECNVFEGATGDFLLIRGDDPAGRLIAPRITIATDARRDADGWPWWTPGGHPLTLERWGRVNWRDKDPDWQDVTGFRGGRDVERPSGQWNELRILCQGEVIETRLNGELINRATKVWPREGKILVQCEGSEIFIRKLAVRFVP